MNKVADSQELHLTEMGTPRMKLEPFVVIWVHGPRGGTRGLMRLDVAEAARLSKALAAAVRRLK